MTWPGSGTSPGPLPCRRTPHGPLQAVDLDDDPVVELEEAQALEADLGEHARRGDVLDPAAADQLLQAAAVERLVTGGECRFGGDPLAPAVGTDEVPDLDVVVTRSLARPDERELDEAEPAIGAVLDDRALAEAVGLPLLERALVLLQRGLAVERIRRGCSGSRPGRA